MSTDAPSNLPVPARAPAKATPGWLLQSALLGQIRSSVQARGITTAALARAIARPEAEVAGALDGTRTPPLPVVEAMLRALRLVPVCVSVDEHAGGNHFRDHLPPAESSTYDRIPVDARYILEDRIRDLTLQRVRLEEAYLYGALEDGEYHKAVLRLTDELRVLAMDLAKIDTAARLFGQNGNDSVEVTYGVGPARKPGGP